MLVELTRVRVKPGKSARVDEWLAMLNARMDEVKETLIREEMHVEVIFREISGDDEFLYWFSIQGEGGAHVNTSPHPLDHDHIAFHEECIDHDYGAHDAQAQVIITNHHLPARSEAPRLTGSLFNKHKSLAGEKIDSSRRCFSSEMGWKNALKT